MRRVSVKRSRIFQGPLQYNCKSLGTGVTNTKGDFEPNCISLNSQLLIQLSLKPVANKIVNDKVVKEYVCNIISTHAEAKAFVPKNPITHSWG